MVFKRRTEAHSGFHEAHSGLLEAHSGYMRRKSESIELLELRAQNLEPLVPFIRLNLKLFKKV